MKTLTIEEQTQEIRSELEKKRQEPHSLIFERVKNGDVTEAANQVLFRVDPAQRAQVVESLEQDLPKLFAQASKDQKRTILSFAVKLSLDFGSFLPAWRTGVLEAPMELARRLQALTTMLAEQDTAVAEDVHGELREDLLTRLGAEKVSDPEEAASIADRTMKSSLAEYIESMWEEYAVSNMRRAAEAHFKGETATTLGNDYAAFLDHALRVGASSQTTNPVLIKLAWDADKTFWDDRVDKIILDEYDRATIAETLESSESERDSMVRHINTLVTTAVVEQNCRMLRDIFLITDGLDGYVNVQVSPDNYGDADAMVTQAVAVYESLWNRLGGIPNAVIKLPATPAGKIAAGRLTKRSIGVTMTLTFSMFQAVELGEVLSQGSALASNIAVMNGRLAYPVRDELSEKGVEGGVEAAQWAGVAVARRVYRRLYDPVGKGGMGLDHKHIRLLIASLRIYGDWLPDISEVWGVPCITVFPNVRRAFDSHPREMKGDSVTEETPPEAIQTMFASELFCQAWWTPEDGEEGKPATPLSLAPKDAEAVASWTPVRQTLDQFIDVYLTMNQMILGRLEHLAEKKT